MQKTIFVTNSVTQSATTDVEGVGTLRWVGTKCYRWIKNGNASVAITVGQAVCYKDTALTTEMDQIVYAAATNYLPFLAGIVASTTIAAGSYGWIQVLGPHSDVLVTGTVTVGQHLVAVNSAAYMAANGDFALTTTAHLGMYRRDVVVIESATTAVGDTTTATTGYVNCL